MLDLNAYLKILLLVTERKSNKYDEDLSHLYVAVDNPAGGIVGFKACKMSVEALG